MENDLISRAALLEDIEDWYNGIGETMNPTDTIIRNVLSSVMDNINVAEAIEAEPVRHGKWEVFDDLSSAYYGKQMYFTQPDGTIYSRLSHGYMTFEEALSEFREAIAKEDDHG